MFGLRSGCRDSARCGACERQSSAGGRQQNLSHALESAVTLNGTRIEVLANIGGVTDAQKIGALGIDLLSCGVPCASSDGADPVQPEFWSD
jgi:hypothetical protein